ncbi:MAG: hypothetical protein GY791_13850 [Alphaproteobacteria bacterium]|nr:hypothetical protein [Alphaproteobacteria bacterium]
MIARIWTTQFDRDRLGELQSFANDISLPVLRRQAGNRGVMFACQGEEWITMTLWDDAESIAGLASSAEYQETVAGILAAGFLRGDQRTTVHEVYGGKVPEFLGTGSAAASKGDMR